MERTFCISCAICALILTSTLMLGVAEADGGQERLDVAVFELTGDGIDAEVLETLTAILRQEAQQHDGYSLANAASIRRDEIAFLIDCDPESTECLRQMGDYVEGRVLIFGEVNAQRSGFGITIDILDIETGEEPVRIQREIDGARDAVAAFRREVETIFESLGSIGETHLVVEAPAADIPIRLENIIIGHGTIERRGMRPGTYHISIGHPDQLWNVDIVLEPGRLVEVRPDIEVEEITDVSPEMDVQETTVVPGEDSAIRASSIEYQRRRSNIGAYSMMTVGITSLTISGVMVFLMRGVENQIAEENAAGTMDDHRYNELTRRGESYQTAQYILLGVGGASLVSGAGWAIWNVWQDKSEQIEPGMAIKIVPAPWGVGLTGTW